MENLGVALSLIAVVAALTLAAVFGYGLARLALAAGHADPRLVIASACVVLVACAIGVKRIFGGR